MSSSLNQRIQNLYDQSSALWESIWGEHMHHGFYRPGENSQNKDRRQAQIDLINELLHWANVDTEPQQIFDLGCGIGGSSLFLADKFRQAKITGISLSPVQINRAKERSKELGFSDRTNFLVADALSIPFPDNSFDLVWSLESGEHMADKHKFLQECDRILKPGGKLILATWCHRPLDSQIGFQPLSNYEQRHLQRIYDVYALPFVISLPEYQAITASLKFENIRTVDWSTEVAPFWDVVITSFLTPDTFMAVLRSGLITLTAAMSLRLMSRGFASGLVRFGVLTATKR
jgi:tocopherol O-methyltransferase